MKLGGFTYTFDEITDVMSSERDSAKGEICFQTTIYTRTEKNQMDSSFFSDISRLQGETGGKDALRRASLGAAVPPR